MGRIYGHVFHQRFWWGVQQDDGDHGFTALGNHGQIVFVWPAKNLLMVRHGERYGIRSWLELFIAFAERW